MLSYSISFLEENKLLLSAKLIALCIFVLHYMYSG